MSSLYGAVIRRVLYPLSESLHSTNVLHHLRFLEQSQYWPEDQLREYQWDRIKKLLIHAYNNTVFYRRSFDALGIKPDDVKDYSDYEKLPILTKKDLKNSMTELRAHNLPEREFVESTTGGTTADYTGFYLNKGCLDAKTAATVRHDRWCGWDIGEKEAIIWPASIDFKEETGFVGNLKNDFFHRKLRLYAGVLNEEILEEICNKLYRFKPSLIRGFPNAMSIVAEYLDSKGKNRVHPVAIKSVGEPLSVHTRKTLERVFDCRVFNYYLSRESATIASQCGELSHMHINAENLYVEFLQDAKPVADGTPGDIVVTDVNNYGVPFLRYRIGDIGTPVAGRCSCGRRLPRMDMTAGRESDFLISPADGSYVMGLSLLVPFVENPRVGQLQVIQDSRDHIVLRIAKGEGFKDSEMKEFEAVVRNIFHGQMRYSYEFVNSIMAERSGKYRFAIRNDF